MDRVKRQLSMDWSYADDTKKLRVLDETHIERLSDELFYEIFDYLDGCASYEAFSNLNNRFQRLLTCSHLPLKINLSFTSELVLQQRYTHIVIPNQHRILSLFLSDTWTIYYFFTLCTSNSSFNRLESIIFNNIELDKFASLFFGLKLLHRLVSLTISLAETIVDHGLIDIYQLIFGLSSLKYFKFSSKTHAKLISLPVATSDHFSAIEHFIIDHPCTLTELITLLSYTLRLRHLSLTGYLESGKSIGSDVPLNLPNLTHLSIHRCTVYFDEFEEFIIKVSSQLQVLRVNATCCDAYLDADRWEQLILQYLPRLRKFAFAYYQFISDIPSFKLSPYHALINRFTALFWINRGWFLELNVLMNEWNRGEIIYSISPYRKNNYESINQNTNLVINHQNEAASSLIHFSQDAQLTLSDVDFTKWEPLFFNNSNSIFSVIQFTRLDIIHCKMSISTFIELIRLLPNLDSLKICAISFQQTTSSCRELTTAFRFVFINNRITKMEFEWLIENTTLDQVAFFIDLCPCIQYLKIHFHYYMDLESIVRFILMKKANCIRHLISLCLSNHEVNDEMVKKLKRMIDFEKLPHNYAIERIYNTIYLQWKG